MIIKIYYSFYKKMKNDYISLIMIILASIIIISFVRINSIQDYIEYKDIRGELDSLEYTIKYYPHTADIGCEPNLSLERIYYGLINVICFSLLIGAFFAIIPLLINEIRIFKNINNEENYNKLRYKLKELYKLIAILFLIVIYIRIFALPISFCVNEDRYLYIELKILAIPSIIFIICIFPFEKILKSKKSII